MIGYEVTLNGKRLCLAATGERGVRSATVTWVYRTAPGVDEPSDLRLEIGGLDDVAHLRWPGARLAVGDEVLIRIVDTNQADPAERTPRDGEAAVAEHERRYYERLKQKFEGK